MTRKIGISLLVVQAGLSLALSVFIIHFFRDFLKSWWIFGVGIAVLIVGSLGTLIVWLAKRKRPCNETFSVTESQRFLKTYSLVLCLVLTGITTGLFLLGKAFVIIPTNNASDAYGYVILGHLTGLACAAAGSFVTAFLFLAFLPFLPKTGKRNLVLPFVSLLLFRCLIEGTLGLMFVYTEVPVSLLISLFFNFATFGVMGLLVYGKSQEYPRVVGKTSFEDSATPLGRKIRNVRVEKGLTQSQLGKLIYLDRSTVAKYELGTLRPTRESLLRISEVLDIDFTSEEWAEAEIQENGAKAD